MTASNQRERILKKAYEMWEAEGRKSGRDMEHWFRAELLIAEENNQIKAKPAAKPGKTKAKPKAKAKAKTPAKAKAKPAAKAKATTRKTPAKPKR